MLNSFVDNALSKIAFVFSVTPGRLTVRAGSDYLAYGIETGAQIIYVHPNYTASNLYADIAVIKVTTQTKP